MKSSHFFMSLSILISLLLSSCQSSSKAEINSLRELQSSIHEIAYKQNKSLVYMEITHMSKGKTRNLSICGYLLDNKGHIATLLIAQENFFGGKAWVNEQEYKVSFLKSDKVKRFTILKLEESAPLTEIQPVIFGDPTRLKNGEFLISIMPSSANYAHEPLISLCSVAGTLEGQSDMIYVNGLYPSRIQGAASIGMPLVNLEGEIVGIFIGNGVIMSDTLEKGVKSILEKLDRGESLNDSSSSPWHGISYQIITETYSEALNLPRHGVLVTRVIDKSPAAKAGLKANDVIIGIDDRKFTRKGIPILSQTRKWLNSEVGRTAKLQYLRNGIEVSTSMTFEEKPKYTSISIEEFGLTVNDITPTDYYHYNLRRKSGVLVTSIESGSSAATSTYFGRPLIGAGDIILEVNHKEVNTVQDLRNIIRDIRNESQNEVLIKLLNGGITTHVSLNISIGQKTKNEAPE